MSNLFISDEEVEKRISNPRNSLVIFKEEGTGKGAADSFSQIDPKLREIIGAYSRATSSLKGAELFSTSQTTALRASRGEINHREVIPELKEAVDKKATFLKEKTINFVDKLLGIADDDEKLKEVSPMQAVSMASQASTIVKNLSREDITMNMGKVTFIIEKPDIEENYDTVDAIVTTDENSVT